LRGLLQSGFFNGLLIAGAFIDDRCLRFGLGCAGVSAGVTVEPEAAGLSLGIIRETSNF
jgi:hypothetical protein